MPKKRGKAASAKGPKRPRKAARSDDYDDVTAPAAPAAPPRQRRGQPNRSTWGRREGRSRSVAWTDNVMDGVPTNPDHRPVGDAREGRHTTTLNWATVHAGQTITVPEGARVSSNRYAFTGGLADVISIENASADGHAMVRPTHEPGCRGIKVRFDGCERCSWQPEEPAAAAAATAGANVSRAPAHSPEARDVQRTTGASADDASTRLRSDRKWREQEPGSGDEGEASTSRRLPLKMPRLILNPSCFMVDELPPLSTRGSRPIPPRLSLISCA